MSKSIALAPAMGQFVPNKSIVKKKKASGVTSGSVLVQMVGENLKNQVEGKIKDGILADFADHANLPDRIE